MKKKALAVISILMAASIPFGCLAKENSADTELNPTRDSTATQQLVLASSEKGATPKSAPIKKAATAATPMTSLENNVADTSQIFSVENLPSVIVINPKTMERATVEMQPRLNYLKITGLKLAEDGKTVDFSVENDFDRTNAQAVRLGGLMLTGMVRFDYDNGAELHNCVLLKEKRVVLEKGANHFLTDPRTYPHVTKIEKLQFFIMPPKDELAKTAATMAGSATTVEADTSDVFSVDRLPAVIALDRGTIEQHGANKDPRLGYLQITGLNVAEDGKTVRFSVDNTFDRQKSEEPIHVGGLMVTGMARYDYDGGAELHSCVLLEEKRLTFRKGANPFQTDPASYPNVTKIENLQFFFTPE